MHEVRESMLVCFLNLVLIILNTTLMLWYGLGLARLVCVWGSYPDVGAINTAQKTHA